MFLRFFNKSILAKNTYSDVVKKSLCHKFAGGDCIEDIHANLKGELLQIFQQKQN